MTDPQKSAILQAVANVKAAASAAVATPMAIAITINATSEAALTEVRIMLPNNAGYEAFAVPTLSLPAAE